EGHVAGAEWARTHLSEQATARARKAKACPTCHGDVHVDLAGDIWTTSNAPTDAEVEAATLELYVRSHHSTGRQTPFESLDHEEQVAWVEDGRAVLDAARSARRDEEER